LDVEVDLDPVLDRNDCIWSALIFDVFAIAGSAVRKLIAFDDDTFGKLTQLGRDRMATFQELADEAFADVLRKHGIPVDLKDALRKSAALSKSSSPSNSPSKSSPSKAAASKAGAVPNKAKLRGARKMKTK
jgi:hypothetical protein